MMAAPHVPAELKAKLREYVGLRWDMFVLREQKQRLELLCNLNIAEHQVPFLTGPDYAFLEPSLALRPAPEQGIKQLWSDYGRDHLLTEMVTEFVLPQSAPVIVDLFGTFTELLKTVKTPAEAQQKACEQLKQAGRGSDLYWTLGMHSTSDLKELIANTLPPILQKDSATAIQSIMRGFSEAIPDGFDAQGLKFQGCVYPSGGDSVKELGSGTFGLVIGYHEGVREPSEIPDNSSQSAPLSPPVDLALKMIKSHITSEDIQQEVQLHRQLMKLAPDSVVPLLGVIRRGDSTCLVLEKADKGSFTSVLKQVFGKKDLNGQSLLTDETELLLRQYLVLDVARKVDQIQTVANIKHLDLKEDNMLVNSKGKIMISDFGTSELGHASQVGRRLGTGTHMAPEMASDSTQYNHKADNWSVGVIIQNILGIHYRPYGSDANSKVDAEQKTMRWAQNKQNRVMPEPKVQAKDTQVSFAERSALPNFMNALMHPEPSKRPTLKAIQEMRYFETARQKQTELQVLFTLLLNAPPRPSNNENPNSDVYQAYAQWAQNVKNVSADLT
jgi:serine/threonine protein kinase